MSPPSARGPEVPTPELRTTVCVVGGGPAGMMLGYLLARRGVETIVLEKHADFFRDFRGDTVHPSTLDVLETLGLLDEFLALTKHRERGLDLLIGGDVLQGPDFRFVTAHNKFMVIVPQWDFLNFLAEKARAFSAFSLFMQAEAFDLIRNDEQVLGVRAEFPEGERDIYADLVVACDGRQSIVRTFALLPLRDLGSPIDVLWFRVERKPSDPSKSFGAIAPGLFMAVLNREDYWQAGFAIQKGGLDALHARGIESFRDDVRSVVPFFADARLDGLRWDDVKLLNVRVDRLSRWAKRGLLAIGDAAHAMSPVGGVGVNLAVQDAIAAANILVPNLQRGGVTLDRLLAVQRRRLFPTKVIQFFQVVAHRGLLERALSLRGSDEGIKRNVRRFGFIRYIAAQLIGVGIRPERPKL